MRIILVTPGSGDTFYCENCLRDATLARAFLRRGCEMLLVPMYLPTGMFDGVETRKSELFFGGINVYLQQKLGIFRKTPRWIDKWLDSPGLLERVKRRANMTNASLLGQMTVSMLRGEDGRQVKEVRRLVEWLAEPENRADVVVLSNLLLGGLAGPIKRRLGIPVVCMLQDEQGFMDGLGRPWSGQAWELAAGLCRDIDLFISVSDYYKGQMAERLNLPPERIDVVHTGIETGCYSAASQRPAAPTIGFLGRMCYDNGLDILLDAAHILSMDERLGNLHVWICGGKTAGDDLFMHKMRRRIRFRKLDGRVKFFDDFGLESRCEFLRGLSVLAAPGRHPAAYGLNVIEAMACGVGFVGPDGGVFRELAGLTGGGVLYEHNTPVRLADALRPILLDAEKAGELGVRGREAALRYFDIEQSAERMVSLFERPGK